MRRCKIAPTGCTRPGKPCCADCGDKTCAVRCWNSPKRCNCWTEGPPPGTRGPRKSAPRKADPLKAAWLYSQGFPKAEIARRLGCCRNTVTTMLREAEVDRHGNS